MKKLFITSLLLASTNSFAGLVSQEVSFGNQGSTNDVEIGFLNETLSINSFDTALGTLTGVGITVFGQMNSEGSSQNTSIANGRADVGISIFQDWKVSTSVADDFIFRSSTETNPFLSDSSALPGTFNLITNTVDDTFNYSLSSGEISSALTNVDFSAFTLGNDIEFNFSGFAQTIITNNVDSGTGFFRNSFQTGSWGKVAVNYTYEPDATTAVPEPSTFAIFALGLMGLSARRFKKQS
mgnify:CR=1 FL=1